MRFITTENTPRRDFHQYMLGSFVPRPIALVSTMGKNGVYNLAPFSYFNAVSSVPPVLMVSVGRSPNGKKKDTLQNIEENGEFVVNMVNYGMLRQMTLASVAFPPEQSEFEMAGFKPIKSTMLNIPRVEGAPIQFECKVKKIIELGDGPGESSVVFGDILCMHVDEGVIDENNRIDPVKLDVMGRLGRSNYTRITQESIETAVQAQFSNPVTYPNLPEHIRSSKILSANEIAILAAVDITDWLEKTESKGESGDVDFLNNPQMHHEAIKNALKCNNISRAIRLAGLGLKNKQNT